MRPSGTLNALIYPYSFGKSDREQNFPALPAEIPFG